MDESRKRAGHNTIGANFSKSDCYEAWSGQLRKQGTMMNDEWMKKGGTGSWSPKIVGPERIDEDLVAKNGIAKPEETPPPIYASRFSIQKRVREEHASLVLKELKEEIQTIPPFAMSGEQPDCSSKQFSAPLKKTPVMRKKYLACSDQSSDDDVFVGEFYGSEEEFEDEK